MVAHVLQHPAILATDPDAGLNGTVTFTLAGEGSPYLSVDSQTGVIRVLDGENMDREENSVLYLQVNICK